MIEKMLQGTANDPRMYECINCGYSGCFHDQAMRCDMLNKENQSHSNHGLQNGAGSTFKPVEVVPLPQTQVEWHSHETQSHFKPFGSNEHIGNLNSYQTAMASLDADLLGLKKKF